MLLGSIFQNRFLIRILLCIINPHSIVVAAHGFSLVDMTGEMPGVPELGIGYYSESCFLSPQRMLEEHSSSGLNVRECVMNSTSKCQRVETSLLGAARSVLNRRVLLKRVKMKDRKRRQQGWLRGHPNRADFDLIKRLVFSSRKNCFIVSTACLDSRFSSTDLLEQKLKFPHFEERSWGSCALVGLSDDMLLRDYGKDIDAHDVVIRMGHLPLTKYKRYVGSRSDIVIYRQGALQRDRKGYMPSDVKAYLCKNSRSHKKTSTSENRKTSFKANKNAASITCDAARGINDYSFSLLSQLYYNMAPNKKTTTGALYALRLAFSRLCNRLDIYGISSGGGGTYFEPKAVTKSKHGTELDSWLLHYLMKYYYEELRTCIYT